jgi:surface antigen
MFVATVASGQCPNDCGPDYGREIGSFMGVTAYSNGDCTEKPCTASQAEYQCVNLAKRFAAAYHKVIDYEVGCAANMWLRLPERLGYHAVSNDSSVVPPQIGDFIIWWNNGWTSCDSGSGHVGIVSRVMRDGIEVFEQNINNSTKPFRLLPMSQNADGTWKVEPGERLSTNYFVKGWLHYPGFSVIGRFADGQAIDRQINNCYNRHGGLDGVGWPIDDGDGIFVHNWAPFRYLCQNFRNARGEESIIIYDPLFGSQAYLIPGKYWEFYRYGRWDNTRGCQRYGPDMPMDDGTVLGCPTSDFINGQQCFQNGYCKSGSVELHRLDGTLVEVFEPTGEFSALTLTGKPMSENHNTIWIEGGPTCDYYAVFANGTEIGQTTLREFTEAGLPTGSTRQYQVFAMSNSTGALDVSNIVTITGPGNPGSFTLQGTADGYNSAFLQWQNTAYPYAPFLWLFRDGVKIAKLVSGFTQWTDYPLEPSHSCTYQLAAVTASELVFGWSNEVTVTTEATPPPPPTPAPTPTTLRINLTQTTWQYATDGWATAQVFDQYGNEMTGVQVLFISSSPSVFVISGDNGYIIANNIGTAETWIELYDDRSIQSERVTVTVVEKLPDPEPPPQPPFPEAPLRLVAGLTEDSTGPYLPYVCPRITYTVENPTDQVVTYQGPSLFPYRLPENVWVDFSSYMSTPVTLQPGQTKSGSVGSSYVSTEPGDYYLVACVRINDVWHVINQAAEGCQVKVGFKVINEADLKAQLKFVSLELATAEVHTGDPLCIQVGIINDGDVNINTPFVLTVGIAGQSSQAIEIDGLSHGGVYYHTFNLGIQAEGSYKVDAYVDSTGVIAEYNEGDNSESTIIQALPPPAQPNLTLANLSVSPAELRVGGTATVSGVMSNSGNEASGVCQLAISFSGQTATVDLPAIPAGGSVPFSVNFNLTAEGTQTVTAVVDSGNVVAESNEGDNSASASVTVLPPRRADCVIMNCSVDPLDPWTGDPIKVTIVAGNIGPVDAPAFNVGLTWNNFFLKQRLPALASGQTAEVIFDLDHCDSSGIFTWRAYADCDSEVSEEDESNNEGGVTFEVISPLELVPIPQLTIIGSEEYSTSSGNWTRYLLSISNWAEYPDRIFSSAYCVTCGLNTSAARTWVEIYEAKPDGSRRRIYGFCALGKASDLTRIWFAVPLGQAPPPQVFIILQDKVDGTVLESNITTIPTPIIDAWDPADGIVSSATVLNNPTTAEQNHGPHTLSNMDRYDWFRVYLVSGRRYNFNTTGGTGNDYAELYSNATGTTRVAYNDDSGGNLQFSFTYAPTVSGWYYLRIRASSVGSNCSYSLKYRDLAVIPPPPANDAWDPADNIVSGSTVLNNPTATEQAHGPHTLSSADRYDWFRVYLVSGRRYNFNTTGGIGDDYGELYSNSAGTVRVAYNDDSGGNLQFSFTYKPNSTGWYYLRIRAYSVGSSCSYSLKYRDLGP